MPEDEHDAQIRRDVADQVRWQTRYINNPTVRSTVAAELSRDLLFRHGLDPVRRGGA